MPLEQKDLDVKATILAAYEAGRMTAVLPFVRLLLEPCMDSKVGRGRRHTLRGPLGLGLAAGAVMRAVAHGAK